MDKRLTTPMVKPKSRSKTRSVTPNSRSACVRSVGSYAKGSRSRSLKKQRSANLMGKRRKEKLFHEGAGKYDSRNPCNLSLKDHSYGSQSSILKHNICRTRMFAGKSNSTKTGKRKLDKSLITKNIESIVKLLD